MKSIKAFYNHNCGWAWACPECNEKEYDGTFAPVAEMAHDDRPGVCSRCYPDILGKSVVEVKPGVFVPGIDTNKQQATIEQATADGRAYKITFPRQRKKIMAALRKRNKINMNYVPGETLEDILDENRRNGVI